MEDANIIQLYQKEFFQELYLWKYIFTLLCSLVSLTAVTLKREAVRFGIQAPVERIPGVGSNNAQVGGSEIEFTLHDSKRYVIDLY